MMPPLPTPSCTTYLDVECTEVATRFYTEYQMQDYGKACAAAEQDRIMKIVHDQANAYGKAGECMAIGIRAKVRNHIADARKLVEKTDWSAA